jgi:hypothetical protein
MRRALAVSGWLLVQFVWIAVPSAAQFGGGRSQYPGQTGSGTSLPRAVPDIKQRSPSGKQNSDEGALPSFGGTIRGIDDKLLTIERPDSNTMEFHCSKKTHYFDGSRKIKAAAVKAGDTVTVDAKRALDGSLDAVNVRVEHPKAS